MNVKIYMTRHGNLSIPLRVDGKQMRIRFVSKDNAVGYYATADEAVQTALESMPAFGSKFRLQSPSYQPIGEADVPLTPVEGITTWQAAREYLSNSPYFEPKRGLNTPEQIRFRAKALGISFPEIKA